MINEGLTDFARHLAEHKPLWVNEESPIQVRVSGQQHFILNEVDAGRLELLRELVATGKLVAK